MAQDMLNGYYMDIGASAGEEKNCINFIYSYLQSLEVGKVLFIFGRGSPSLIFDKNMIFFYLNFFIDPKRWNSMMCHFHHNFVSLYLSLMEKIPHKFVFFSLDL